MNAVAGRAPRATVSRSALAHNIAALRGRLDPSTTMAPIVKANGYGHGRDLVVEALNELVDLFTVAEPADALALAAIAPGRVLCVGPAYGEELAALVAAGVRVAVSDRRALPELGPDARVHLLVDTGLHRLGVSPSAAVELAEEIRGTGATLEGVFCHVAGADHQDWERVEAEVRTLRELPLGTLLRHSGGSTLVISRPDLVGDLARPGIAVFGHLPRPEQREVVSLRPALTLSAPIVELRHIKRYERIGYGGVPVERDTVVATLPIGACHGLNPGWANGGGAVSIRGRSCALLTPPMLDYTLVDVTDVPGASFDDVATVLGGDGPSAEETGARLGLSAEHVLIALQTSLIRELVD
jgi:alanine racemase